MSKDMFNSEKSRAGGIYDKYIKRVFDIVLCILALVLFWWMFLIISIIVKKHMGMPILYKSHRLGRYEEEFELLKFRSMTNETDENGMLLPGSQRLTKFGKKLRSTSLDEIPSVFNILRGDMSIVGPRPLLPKYQPFFYGNERVRHGVRPGLTGLAQVKGRTAISWDEKFQYDIEYVEHMSLAMDIKIFFLTVYKVFKRSDIVENRQDESLHIVRSEMVKK